MIKAIKALSRILAVLASFSIMVMVFSVAADVFVRNLSGGSLPGMIEVAESSLVVSVFFGLAWAGVKGEHVAVTLLADRFTPAGQRRTNIFAWIVSTLFLAWMLWATVSQAIDSTVMGEERFGLVRWPVYPMRWIIVVGLLMLFAVAVANLILSLVKKKPLGYVSEVEAALDETGDPPAVAGDMSRATEDGTVNAPDRTISQGTVTKRNVGVLLSEHANGSTEEGTDR